MISIVTIAHEKMYYVAIESILRRSHKLKNNAESHSSYWADCDVSPSEYLLIFGKIIELQPTRKSKGYLVSSVPNRNDR